MANKKYLIKTVNFGEIGHPSRVLVEKFIKLNGKVALSNLMRKLIILYLSGDPKYKNFKISAMIQERKDLGDEIYKLGKKRNQIQAELEDLGVNLEEGGF